MALQQCPDCGGQLSTTARFCPHCGAQKIPKVAFIVALTVSLVVLAIGAAVLLTTRPPSEAGAEAHSLSNQATQQLKSYVKRLRDQDATGLAEMFEQDGISVHKGQPPIVGRDAIRKSLESFASYRVQKHTMTVDKTSETNSEVVPSGTFDQAVVGPDGKTIQVSGEFTATWRQQPDGKLLLHSMQTRSSGDAAY